MRGVIQQALPQFRGSGNLRSVPQIGRRIGEAANRLGGDLGDKLSTVKDDLKHRAGDVKSAIGAGREAYARARTGDEPVPTSNAM